MTGCDGREARVKSCIPAMLREHARLRPDDTAFTFVDYEQDSDGVPERLTWSQLYRRALSVAQALRVRGSTGDRALILAPHGPDYVAAFLGALQAGLIAVPLSLPLGGASDELVLAVLRDTSPAVILTTSSEVGSIKRYVDSQRAESAPLVVYVDWLDLDFRKEAGAVRESWPATAYLQYTSGSNRPPAGVVVSHSNLLANFEQMVSDYFGERGEIEPRDTSVVSWLPFDRDMGLMLGICAPILGGFRAVLMSPASFLQRPVRWIQLLARSRGVWSVAPNFAYELVAETTSDNDMIGLDLRHVLGILDSSERIHAASVARFTKRFARFNLPEAVIRPTYGLPEATAYVATRRPACPPQIVRFEPEQLSAGYAHRCQHGTALISYGVPRWPAVRIVNPYSRIECPAQTAGEIWVHGDNVALGYWQKQHETERTFGARLAARSPGTPEGPWLRTGDVGFFSDGELFIMGRIKDLLIVDGPNRYPGMAPGGGRHREKLTPVGDHHGRGGSPGDPVDGLGDFLNSCVTPPANTPGQSMPYKMSG
jgi:long-chain fatty acid adenylyltransferase FadD28